jgi:sugar phosphate isomerase/epimerase
MTLGYSTYALRELVPLAAVKAVADASFDAIEICCLVDFPSAPEKLGNPDRVDLRKKLADSGLRLSALMENLPVQAEDAAHQRSLDRLAAAAQLGHALSPADPPIVETIVGGGAGKWDAVKPIFLKRLPDWAKVAEKEKVTIAIKPHRMSAMSSPGQTISLLKELGNPPGLKMVYDWSHYDLRDDLKDKKGQPVTISSTVAESLPYTVFVAAKDVVMENGKAAFKLPGETGQTDHAAVIKALHAGGYTGDINCEVSAQLWKQKGFDAMAAMKKCYEGMSAAFEKAGVKRKAR